MCKNKLIENMIIDRTVNCLEIAYDKNIESYIEYFKNKKSAFSLPNLNDEIAQFIFSGIYDYFDEEKRNARTAGTLVQFTKRMLSNLDDLAEKNIDEFLNEFKNFCETYNSSSKLRWGVFHYFELYKDILDSNGDFLRRNLWNIDEFEIMNERITNSAVRTIIDFRNVNNEINKTLVRKYAYNELVYGNNCVSTITSEIRIIENFLNLIEKPYINWTKNDAGFAFNFYASYIKKKSLSNYYLALSKFTDFLIERDIIDDSPIKTFFTLGRNYERYQYKTTAPDEYVVRQIFSKLNQFREVVGLWFLIIKNTGCRGAEATEIRRDCLFKTKDKYGNDVYNITLKINKFLKRESNVIPQNLYILIENWIKNNPSDSEFLFPSSRKIKQCIARGTFVSWMKEDIAKMGILNSDGTPYNYRPHDFRHLMAVEMDEKDIPIGFIQAQLHHANPNMTMAYVEYTQKKLMNEMNEFYNKNGEISPLNSENKLTDDEEYVLYMTKYINARTLTNGICGKSSKLGSCPHGNSCLDCANFRTNKTFLPHLKEQLERSRRFLVIAEENNWLPQIKTNQKDIEKLEKLISKLETNSQERESETNERCNTVSRIN